MPGSGTLVIAATPIGNLADASPRLRDALQTADVIAAEDTRRLRRLLDGLAITTSASLVSYYDAVEADRVPQLIDHLRAGRGVVLVSDAGMPLVSDPGHRLVAACAAQSIQVTVVPGPSAALAAAAVAGFGGNRLSFEGFPPRRRGERLRALEVLRDDPRTMVYFESPHRVGDTLGDMADVFGPDRPAVVCRELTKMYEEIRRGTLAELASWAGDGLRGEVTIVVSGSTRPEPPIPRTDDPRKAALAAVAAAFGVDRKAVYDAVVAAKAAAPPAP